jgi:hypothetical protein
MALSTTARSTPVGTKLKDGYQTLIAFSVDPDISFWEKTVTPPGFDGGELIDQTTMFNTTVMTYAERALFKVTDAQLRAAYTPKLYDQLLAIQGTPGTITVHFPDGSTLDFAGVLKSAIPGENVEGTQPEIVIVIGATNVDPSTGVEVVPDYKVGPGC